MQVTVKLFAHLRNIAGTDRLRVDLNEGATVAELLDHLSKTIDSPALTDNSISLMVDHKNAVPETTLKDGDEVLLLPIIGGG
jgi:molybdopterin converting factor small subunit